MKRRTAIVAAVIGGLVCAGVAGAVLERPSGIPDASGVIHACYRAHGPSVGTVRVLPAADACKSSEQPLAWSQTGPQGATGAAGPQGAPGPAGAAGAAGAAGSQGPQVVKTWRATASIGQTVTLLTIGPFTYTGECTAGPHAQTYVATSQANSVADSYAQSSWDPFNPSDGAVAIGYGSYEHQSDGSPQWVGPYDGSDTQMSGDGHTFVNTFASVGTQVPGFPGADCVFVGWALTTTS
jgi:hypothetical protein